MLSQSVEGLIVGRIELHLPGETMLHLLRNGWSTFETIFTLWHGEVLELLTVLRFLQQQFVIIVEETDLARSL